MRSAPQTYHYRFGTLYLSCNFACFSSHVPGLVSLVLPLKDVNCIEKSATHATTGGRDEAIVFTMRRGGKSYVFGQVGTLQLLDIQELTAPSSSSI